MTITDHTSSTSHAGQASQNTPSATAITQHVAGDFLEGEGAGAIAFSRDGRRIIGTVEVAYVTGSLASISRDARGGIQYDFTDNPVDSQHASYSTLNGEDGQPFFFDEDSRMVAERDVVLVSPSLVEVFLASCPAHGATDDATEDIGTPGVPATQG